MSKNNVHQLYQIQSINQQNSLIKHVFLV